MSAAHAHHGYGKFNILSGPFRPITDSSHTFSMSIYSRFTVLFRCFSLPYQQYKENVYEPAAGCSAILLGLPCIRHTFACIPTTRNRSLSRGSSRGYNWLGSEVYLKKRMMDPLLFGVNLVVLNSSVFIIERKESIRRLKAVRNRIVELTGLQTIGSI